MFVILMLLLVTKEDFNSFNSDIPAFEDKGNEW